MTKTFPIRGFNLCESLLRHTPRQIQEFIHRMRQWNLNTLIAQYDYGWNRYHELLIKECVAANIEIILMTFGPRTFFKFSGWKNEYFAKDEDGRPFCHSPECELQPCGSNPEALEAFQYGAKLFFKSLPQQIKHVHMRAGDGYFFCRCPKCKNKSCREQWTPYISAFIDAAAEVAPHLKLEADIYNRRYSIPHDPTPYKKLDQMMFDTFFRNSNFALDAAVGEPLDLQVKGLIDRDEEGLTANRATCLVAKRLQQWCNFLPHHIYIHENAMRQGFFGVYQRNTHVMLKDLLFYQKLGVRGVCYEAYEPGFSFFESSFHTLAASMQDTTLAEEYIPDRQEKLASEPASNYCRGGWIQRFPLDWIEDTVERKLLEFYRRHQSSFDPRNIIDFIRYSLEHRDRLDYLYSGFTLLRMLKQKRPEICPVLSEAEEYFLAHRKPWDFMENLHCDSDPIAVVTGLITSIVNKFP